MAIGKRAAAILNSAIDAAYEAGVGEDVVGSYAAGVLAQRIASIEIAKEMRGMCDRVEDPAGLRKWIEQDPARIFDTLEDIDWRKFVESISQDPRHLGHYIIGLLEEQREYEESFSDADTAAQEDELSRYRDYKLEKLGVC